MQDPTNCRFRKILRISIRIVLSLVGLLAAIYVYFLVIPNLFPSSSSAKATEEAWKKGEVVRAKIDRWKSENGKFPDNLDQLELMEPDVIYIKQGSEDFTLSIRMKGKREFMTYFGGHLGQRSGWYHSGYGINGVKQLSSHPYAKQ